MDRVSCPSLERAPLTAVIEKLSMHEANIRNIHTDYFANSYQILYKTSNVISHSIKLVIIIIASINKCMRLHFRLGTVLSVICFLYIRKSLHFVHLIEKLHHKI